MQQKAKVKIIEGSNNQRYKKLKGATIKTKNN